jgi:hypothetical protein
MGAKEPAFKRPNKGLMRLINIELMALTLFTLSRLYYNILLPTFTSLGSV